MPSLNQVIKEYTGKSRRQLLMEELQRHMSGISEEAFFAGWDYRVADELPAVLTAAAMARVPAEYHGAVLRPIHAAWLVSLATELGHWVNIDEGKTVAYYPPTLSSAPAVTVGHDGE